MQSRFSTALAMRPSLPAKLFPPDVRERLSLVADLTAPPFTDPASPEARETLARTELLLTGWGCPPLTAGVLDSAPRLRAVVHAAGSVKGHVTAEVFDRGIAVSSAAEANAAPVADYTAAMLVLAAKDAFGLARSYRGGRRPAPEAAEGTGIRGTTVGVVGASRVGRLVLERLRPFGCRLLLADPCTGPEEAHALGAEHADLDGLCRTADLVTLHAPELPETRGLLGERRLALLRRGAVLVNTARGSLVDTAALTRHCAEGRISAVLDVTDPEPLPEGHPLFGLPNVVLTPHMAGAQGGELRLLGEFAAAEAERLAAGLPLRGAVRAADLPRIA